MPLDNLNLQTQTKTFIEDAISDCKKAELSLEQAVKALENYSKDIPTMQKAIKKAESRVAVPYHENPAKVFPPPSRGKLYNLVCTDGSQIIPNPHEGLVFALVNVGVITIPFDRTQTIKSKIISNLYQHKDLYNQKNELVSEAQVNLDRDVREMECLQKACEYLDFPIIALRDGLLELYHDLRAESEFQKKSPEYQDYFMKLYDQKVILASYVDKPLSQMVSYLLHLCTRDDKKEKVNNYFYPQIIDQQLFKQKLKSGERSAVFENYLPTRQDTEQCFFFYLNVSSNKNPYIVRVEIPHWVADAPEGVNLLHFALLEQCAIMGSKPYPYCLYRAHETALVSQQEKDELKNWILSEMVKAGYQPNEKSAKQSAKDLPRHKKLERK